MLKKFLKKNSYRIYILQLANSRENYFKILDQKFLNDENYINNVKLYKSFLDKNSQNKYLLKPKCIIIGTLPSIEDKYDLQDFMLKQ